jgi:hypothetical protein
VFSPDGRWIAYESDKTGRHEIYVRPFPGPGNDFLASTSGASQVRWSRDGKELFYIGADDRLMAQPITASSDGKTVDFGTPTPLLCDEHFEPGCEHIQTAVRRLSGRSFVRVAIAGGTGDRLANHDHPDIGSRSNSCRRLIALCDCCSRQPCQRLSLWR